ncbi:uncharacterized protein LOC113234835 [Hyposmocoma kahamanoa]|uniref:uncharacterized protein LOC113234835 n=1 Tax=Hyposmocoma kahamanoa TaxID=1477025 RepID=UPI000E6D63AC|nr:uncharacterized protein LOC113234835 [Hyposmocoma kahamanoa]
MKFATLFILSLAVILVNCGHTFMGTNVQKQLLYRTTAKYSANMFTKRIEYMNYTMPNLPAYLGRYIQGFLAYDMTNTGASCNVTGGGVGMNFLHLRMKSDRGKPLNYEIFIYS